MQIAFAPRVEIALEKLSLDLPKWGQTWSNAEGSNQKREKT